MEKELWKDVKDYENIYQVSNLGRVKSLERLVKHSTGSDKVWKERILKPSKCKKYYSSVTLAKLGTKNNENVHRLVSEAFIPKVAGKLWINHKDGNKFNPTASNLEWCTPAENELHKIHVLNIKPTICNFKNVKQINKVMRYENKNIYGIELQALLKRFISGEVVSIKEYSRLDKRHFYGKINELRYRFNIPIVAKKNGTKYKDFLLIRNFKVNMNNLKPKGNCKIWELESGIEIKERSIGNGCKAWSL